MTQRARRFSEWEEGRMRVTRPHWFPVIDFVLVALVLIVGVWLLLGTMEIWGH
jgi:hypothetical protein